MVIKSKSCLLNVLLFMFFMASHVSQSSETVHESVDYSKSTEENYASSQEYAPIIGKYGFLRKLLDYNYHKHYTVERQLLHDSIIDQTSDTVIHDADKDRVCSKPAGGNWIVFTAGAFGSGKSHVLSWLNDRGLFPLQSFVVVDPDLLRKKLPETAEYIRRNPSTAGYLTQKEVGYISEVMVLKALLEGKNVIVDGSLKDSEWYSQYMLQLRNTFPRLQLAIVHVVTSLETALRRADRRGAETGRMVPLEAISQQLETIPQSVLRLQPFVDYTFTFRNEDVPELIDASRGDTSLAAFKDVWAMSCREDNGEENHDDEVCPDNLLTWQKNNYYRLFFSPNNGCCKINSSL